MARTAQTIEIEVRRPDFAFESAEPIWTPANLDFGYQFNGGSLTLPYLEPYLIRVMRKAKARLADRLPSRPSLQRDIDLFCAQEAQHFKLHAQYNAMLRERYDGLEAFEAEIEADFARMEKEESLAFNLGYAAGFETTGMLMAQLFFEGAVDSLEGADPATRQLWGWHLAEEYEHRCVAIEVFRALGGGYRERLRLFFYQQRHLMGFGTRAAAHMRAQDEAAGRLVFSPQAMRDMAKRQRRANRYGFRKMVAGLAPWHDPRAHPPLAGADAFLETLSPASA